MKAWLRPATLYRKMKAGYGAFVYEIKFRLRPRLLASLHGRRLERVSGNASLNGKPVVAVVPFHGNAALLTSFLDHHRRLGIDFFVFLDLSPGRSLATVLPAAKDVAVWRPPQSAPLRLAPHWLNDLRRRYAVGRWCLSVEPTELFVFPRCESRHIRDLLELMESENRDHLYALVIDTYGDEPATAEAAARVEAGTTPLERLPYFDGVGYSAQTGGRFRSTTTRGGVQRRTIFKDEPQRSPPLNRIPLVKWSDKFCYVAGTRTITPRHLNSAHSPWHLSPTGCLLRYGLLDDEDSLAIAATVEASALVRDGAAPSYSGLSALRHQSLTNAGSVRYRTSQDLVDWGLMMPGQWF